MHVKFETEIPRQTWITMPKPCRLPSPETEESNMATRQPFRKRGNWKSISSYSYTQVLGHWSFEFLFKTKLKLESRNQTIQYGCQVAILELTALNINRLLPIYISTLPLKFGVDIQSQTKVRVWEPRNPMWLPGGHWKVTWMKIGKFLPMTTINMHMEFEIEIRKQTLLTPRQPCRLPSPDTEKPNMVARRPFWKWRSWKSKGSYPYT